MAKKTLPKTIYVYREVDRESSYLVASASVHEAADANEARVIGTYELVEQGTVSMKTEYKRQK